MRFLITVVVVAAFGCESPMLGVDADDMSARVDDIATRSMSDLMTVDYDAGALGFVFFTFEDRPPFLNYPPVQPNTVTGTSRVGVDGAFFASPPAMPPFALTFKRNGSGFAFQSDQASGSFPGSAALRSVDFMGGVCTMWSGTFSTSPPPDWRLTMDAICDGNHVVRIRGEWRGARAR